MRISDWSSDVCSSDLRVRIIEGLGRYPYPRADDHPSGTRTGAPSPILERPGGLEGKQADTGPTAPRLIQQCMKARPFQAVIGENRHREYELGWEEQVSSWCAQEVRGQRPHALRNRSSSPQTGQIGRAYVRTPVTTAHHVCSLLLEKKKTK